MLFQTLFTIIYAATLVVAGPGAFWYTSSGAYTGGKSNITVIAGKVTGYFYAVEYFFSGNHVAYIGLQPRTDGPNELIFSVFGTGPTNNDPSHCVGGADGGSGVSCSTAYAWEFNKTYTTEIKRESHNDADGTSVWVGYLHDNEGTSIYIGNFTTPASYGSLEYPTYAFDEWYLGTRGRTSENDCLPFSSYIQYPPVLYNDAGTYQTHLVEIQSTNIANGVTPCSPHNESVQRSYKVDNGGIRFENGLLGVV